MNPRNARIDAYVSVATRTAFDDLARRSGRTRAHILESAVREYLDAGCPLLDSPLDAGNERRVRIDAYVLPELRTSIDQIVDASGRSLSNIVESAVRRYLGSYD